MQARSSFAPRAAHSYLDIWRKIRRTDKKRRRHRNQTNPTRPKTRYYAHTQLHIPKGTYFRWYGLITWNPPGIYEGVVVLPNGRVVNKYTAATYWRGGCRA
jgi:hypothetical protein